MKVFERMGSHLTFLDNCGGLAVSVALHRYIDGGVGCHWNIEKSTH